jgi:hypothetical protein
MKRTEKETDTEAIINKDKLSENQTDKESEEAETDHNMMKKKFKK